jgi:hypothetical protein
MKNLKLLKGTTLSLSIALALSATVQADEIIPSNCVLYGVHDEGLNNSQFVVIDDVHVSALGQMHPKRDIEGLDIDPVSLEIYASSGDDPEGYPAGHLYKVDGGTGEITSVGDIAISYTDPATQEVVFSGVSGKEVSALSFDPSGNLWGWAEECGLLMIDKATAQAQLVVLYPDLNTCLYVEPAKYSSHIEDMTWDPTGTIIYAAESYDVIGYAATPEAAAARGAGMWKVATLGEKVEAVETLPDGTLLLGMQSTALTNLDPVTGALLTKQINTNGYDDIEGLTWSCPDDLNGQQGQCDTGWTYIADSHKDGVHGDSIGGTLFELYGVGVKETETEAGIVVTIAMNTNLPLEEGDGDGVTWGDLTLDFDAVKYGIRFVPRGTGSNSGVSDIGLYRNVENKYVAKNNSGFNSLNDYRNYVVNRDGEPSLGDLAIIDNGYFGNYDKIPTSIKNGTLVDAQFSMLTAAQLAEIGLVFPADYAGTETFGFSFLKQDDMDMSNLVAYVFTECGNDGMAISRALPVCAVEEEPPVDEPPVDEPPVDEPPVDEPPVDEPPVDEPPVDEPPVDEPPVACDTDNETVIALGDNKNSTYGVSLVAHQGNTWSYCVREIEGRDLSHWSLGIGACLNHIVDGSVSPTVGYEAGPDGSTDGFLGTKWNTDESFDQGIFTFTLDADYAASNVEVLAKAGTAHEIKSILGPICGDTANDEPVDGGDDAANDEPVDGGDDTANDESVDGGDEAANDEPVDGGDEAANDEPVDGGDDAANNESDNGETVIEFQGTTDLSSYGISLVGVEGRTWVYRVRELAGHDLSHWAIGLDKDCIDSVSSGGEIGKDGSTKFVGVKWDVTEGFTDSMFAITMDGDYPRGDVDVLAKASDAFGLGTIAGPVCVR